ncbi:hemoglobin subunit alpha-like [Hypanus sabinus]|uniref:hemoglobin subunit alpha-like n=1 Tax=Hypanus sabinus TaxID=79690 RepID=UPI0028C3EEA7|nr:hemoglobin subunit alpha-like [Hypanus sabinus]
MVLSDANKKIIRSLGKDIKANAELLGADALARLFQLHPQTKTYFGKFATFDACDTAVKLHGSRVMNVVGDAALNVDNLRQLLESLADKHGKQLLVDPNNFHLFADCIAVTLAIYLPDFSPEIHRAVDKFLELVTHELVSKYR